MSDTQVPFKVRGPFEYILVFEYLVQKVKMNTKLSHLKLHNKTQYFNRPQFM